MAPSIKNRFNRIMAPRSARGGLVTDQAASITRPRPDPSIATAPAPAAGQTDAQTTTEAYTYFTKANGISEVLYRADRLWVTVTVTLETAGPVAVGFKSKITPVLSGKGMLLTTGLPQKLVVAKGSNQLYIASTSVNRVKVQVEPLPWLEQIMAVISSVLTVLGKGK